MQISDLNWY